MVAEFGKLDSEGYIFKNSLINCLIFVFEQSYNVLKFNSLLYRAFWNYWNMGNKCIFTVLLVVSFINATKPISMEVLVPGVWWCIFLAQNKNIIIILQTIIHSFLQLPSRDIWIIDNHQFQHDKRLYIPQFGHFIHRYICISYLWV